MRCVILCLIFVCYNVSFAVDPITKRKISIIKDLAQLDIRKNVYVAELDFDMSPDISDCENNSLLNEAKDIADYSIKESIAGNSKSISDSLIMKAEVEKIHKILVNERIQRKLFQQFSNKPYFDSKTDERNCISLELIKSRFEQLKTEMLETGVVVAADNLMKVLDEKSDLITMPVAAFIIHDGMWERWVIVRAWEDYDDDEIKSDQCITLGHISGVVYDLNFENEIITFTCM